MKITKYILLALLLFSSQRSQSQDTIPAKANPRAVDLNEVIISVNKTEETKRTVAQQIHVITAIQILNSQSQSMADLLANSGMLSVQKSQAGGGSPVIRGFEANRILLVVDGVRMNNLIYRGGHLQNIITFDNTILDRLEILFGPSSTVYGSDALGGVIHMYTRKPAFSREEEKNKISVNAFSRYGCVNNEAAGHFDFNIGGRKLASLTSFTYSSFDDMKGGKNQNPFYTSSYGERPYYVERINGRDSLIKNSDRFLQVQSGYKQYDILQKFAYKQSNDIVHTLNLQASNSTDVPRYDRLTDPDGSGLRFAEWYYGPQKRILAAYDVVRIKSASFFQNIRAIVNYQNIEESRHQRRFGNDNLQHRYENVNVFGFNADLQRNTVKHSIRLGLDAQYNTLKSTADIENIVTGVSDRLDTRYPDGDNSMSNVAAYFSHTWRINDEVSMTDGIRVGVVSLSSEFEDSTFFHLPYTKAEQSNLVYSGSIGFINTPSDDLKLSILFSTGFRAPNIDDLSKVFESSQGNVIVPNSDLKPEKTVNSEIGITKIYNGKTSWETSVYSTHFIDAIVTDKFTFNGQDSILYDGTLSQVFANQNKRKAYLYGLSSNIRSQSTDNLLIEFGLNYTYGRVKTDSIDYPLDHIPPFMMHFQLTFTNKNFSSDLVFNYHGWKKINDYFLSGEDNEQYATPEGMPAWFTASFRSSYKVHKLITLQAGMENILDTQYRVFASGINSPGRNVFGCVRFHY